MRNSGTRIFINTNAIIFGEPVPNLNLFLQILVTTKSFNHLKHFFYRAKQSKRPVLKVCNVFAFLLFKIQRVNIAT